MLFDISICRRCRPSKSRPCRRTRRPLETLTDADRRRHEPVTCATCRAVRLTGTHESLEPVRLSSRALCRYRFDPVADRFEPVACHRADAHRNALTPCAASAMPTDAPTAHRRTHEPREREPVEPTGSNKSRPLRACHLSPHRRAQERRTRRRSLDHADGRADRSKRSRTRP